MRTLCLALCLALSAPALAQEAPTLTPNETTYTLTEKEMELLTMRLARLDAENKTMRKEVEALPSTRLMVVVGIVAGVVLFGAGVATGYAVTQKLPQK